MARYRKSDDINNEDSVQDSFLDIVANIVGILILLVIIVGVRAAMQPQIVEDQEVADSTGPVITEAMLKERESKLLAARSDIANLVNRVAEVEVEAESMEVSRMHLASYNNEVAAELERAKSKLSEDEAARLAVRTELAKADHEWEKVMLEKVALASKTEETEKLIHTPTPIVRSQSEKTLHLRLEKGRVAVVPFEALLGQLDGRPLDAHRRDLQRLGGIGRLGPIAGFELQYALISRASDPGPGGARQVITFLAGEIHPASEHVGEELDEALAPGSTLQAALAKSNPRDTIVMVWTYPDSTSQYRQLQGALRERQFAVDLRLLDAGTHISFSPEGRKTAAQ
jgi:hypothetical protein